jgi:hypothetical protein
MHVVEQALGVPMKRFERPMLGFLSREEMLAIIGSPTWAGSASVIACCSALMYNTGARVSEVIGVKVWRRGARRCGLRSLARQGTQGALGAAVALDGQGDRAWLRLNADLNQRRHCCPTGMARR